LILLNESSQIRGALERLADKKFGTLHPPKRANIQLDGKGPGWLHPKTWWYASVQKHRQWARFEFPYTKYAWHKSEIDANHNPRKPLECIDYW